MNDTSLSIERHPWPPFVPQGTRLFIMGTFPPGQHRWSMPFFYPNPTNDFWRVMGLVYYNDKDKFYKPHLKTFDLVNIKNLLISHHIALGDTGLEIRRLKGNAADKFLDIVTPIPLAETLKSMPDCVALATTGEKAAQVIAEITNTQVPPTGTYIETNFNNRELRIYRMPSTSRAYPLPLIEKAKIYRNMLSDLHLCDKPLIEDKTY